MREVKRHFTSYFLSCLVVFIFFMFSRYLLLKGYGLEPDENAYLPLHIRLPFNIGAIVVASAFFSLFTALVDVYVLSRIVYRKSLAVVFIAAVVTHSLIIKLSLSFVNSFIRLSLKGISGQEIVPTRPYELGAVILQLILAVIMGQFFIVVEKKLGPGNFWKLITGRFYKPREEERIFMFIDLRSSTTIAERLGHYTYSRFIKDCFNDFAVVDRFNAEIYQYVGDEVVISWPASEIKNFRHYLNAFYAFQEELEKRRNYYEETYGVFPVFKAGTHAGPAIVTEVGVIKREITYHGDTINTAARIQDRCNEFGTTLLVSQELVKHVPKQPDLPYTFEDVGAISLKGKQQEVRLYKVMAA